MAATRIHQSGSGTSGVSIGELSLPTGSCDFRDLSSARALKCGCKRFWLNGNHYSSVDGNNDKAYCFCGHHACFHNATSQPVSYAHAAASTTAAIAPSAVLTTTSVREGQGNYEVPKIGQSSHATGLGIHNSPSAQPQSINTRVWEALNGFARDQEDGELSHASSRLPSTATPSLAGDTGMGADQARPYQQMMPPINVHMPYQAPGSDQYSATEIATPSVRGTPDLQAATMGVGPPAGFVSPDHQRPAIAGTSARPAAHPLQQPGPSRVLQLQGEASTQHIMSQRELQEMVKGYGRRIDVLETLSFSHVHLEDVQDKFDLIDGRLLDLEHWRIDHQGAHAPEDVAMSRTNKHRRLLPAESSSSASEGSFDSAAAAYTDAVVLATLAANEETGPRIANLESRVNDLENTALPSFARPWEIQVVLLPWGRDVRGVWYSALEATQQSLRSTQASEDWTGAHAAQQLSFKSADSGAWTTESIQAWANEAQEWLSPKACGPSGVVFERLASRGFVREVTLTASDPRHVLRALEQAFGSVLPREQTETSPDLKRYQGLCERYIPLRKIRQSTRLRFLSRSEMTTPATWTASFLDSCAMKVKDGQRRLYITTPEAYLQSDTSSWSWQRLRQLPMHDATGEEQAAQATNVAIEACWSYNDRLDHKASMHSSFASHASQWSMRSQHSTEPQTALTQAVPLSPHSEDKSVHHRAVSMPSSNSALEQVKSTIPKRRVASFETAGSGVPGQEATVDIVAAAKRRRISTSPEAERRGAGFTPRLSREPPSPYTSEHAGEARSQGTTSRKRGTTPFAYATPHSHSNHAGYMTFVGGGDGDTEPDSEMAALPADRAEDEWQGVEEGQDHGDGRESEVDEQDIDEEDLDEGLTIYEA